MRVGVRKGVRRDVGRGERVAAGWDGESFRSVTVIVSGDMRSCACARGYVSKGVSAEELESQSVRGWKRRAVA